MPQEGEFSTARRIHVALAVTDLAPAIRFYETLLGEPPVKVREGYAKFEAADPSLNLALNAVSEMQRPAPPSHFGIQVKSAEVVKEATERFRAAGLETEIEEAVSCCYAVQDKVWVTDPDGHKWEIFVVLDKDSPIYSPRRVASECCAQEEAECCDEPRGCCA